MLQFLERAGRLFGLILATAGLAGCPQDDAGPGANGGGVLGGAKGSGGSTVTGGTTAGIFFYTFAGELHALDVATGLETTTKLPARSRGGLGAGPGFLTDVEETGPSTNEFLIHRREYTASAFQLVESLGPISFPGDDVWGDAAPSPDGSLFLLSMRESDGVYALRVIDRSGKAVGRIDAFAPTWVSANRAVYAGDDGLFAVTIGANGDASAPERIGKPGLGAPGRGPHSPSASRDGTMLVFVQGDMVWRMGIDGSDLTQVTKQRTEQFNPIFSPDGSAIVVQYGTCRTTWAKEVIVPLTSRPIDPMMEGDRIKKVNPYDSDKKQRTDIGVCGPAYWMP